ncbi:MAG TPA: hypothetical protein VHO72_04660 [Bacteroidales bacterium]|nr:hypothetical protein [Bacteroidales bacterium]
MKKILLLVCFIIIGVVSAYSQKLDFTIRTDSTAVNGSKVYTITIDVIKGNGPFSCYLYNKQPWIGGVIKDQKLNISSSRIIFKDLSVLNNEMMVLVKGLGEDEFNWRLIATTQSK